MTDPVRLDGFCFYLAQCLLLIILNFSQNLKFLPLFSDELWLIESLAVIEQTGRRVRPSELHGVSRLV
jgi:hypothetical protein